MTTTTNDTTTDEATEDIEMTRRAFGVGTLLFGSGTHILGRPRNRIVSTGSMVEEFKGVRARITDKSIIRGYELYVFGMFEEHVNNERVTVTVSRDDGTLITEKSYRVTGTAFGRTFRVRRFPDDVYFSRG